MNFLHPVRFFHLFYVDHGSSARESNSSGGSTTSFVASEAARNRRKDRERFPLFSRAIRLLHCPNGHVKIKARNACLYVLNLLDTLERNENVVEGSEMYAWFRRECCQLVVDATVSWREALLRLGAAGKR